MAGRLGSAVPDQFMPVIPPAMCSDDGRGGVGSGVGRPGFAAMSRRLFRTVDNGAVYAGAVMHEISRSGLGVAAHRIA